MAADERRSSRLAAGVIALGALAISIWIFPWFHVVRLTSSAAARQPAGSAAFDARAAAARVWSVEIPSAIAQAASINAVLAALRTDPQAARKQFGQSAGTGTVYFLVRGRGRVVARERNQVRVAIDGAAEGDTIAIRCGPVFGNTVRDGCGRLDLNAFPGLAEFNALSSELNALIEKSVMPALREKAAVASTITFVGCAEAPDSPAEPGEPVLTVIPVEAEVR